MIEYEPLINEYSCDGYSMFSKAVSRARWGDKSAATEYLQKYWLAEREYEDRWRKLLDRVFVNRNDGLPRLSFTCGFEVLIRRGGCLFVEDEFRCLQRCMVAAGDKQLVIVENTLGQQSTEPTFRMKYPSNVSWEELNSGNFASAILIEMPHKEYFVMGDSSGWGKYAANDYEFPLDVLGFREEYRTVFRQQFKVPEFERRELARLIPPACKVRHPGAWEV